MPPTYIINISITKKNISNIFTINEINMVAKSKMIPRVILMINKINNKHFRVGTS